MEDILIREAQPEDAAKMIAYSNRVGGESDNLTFGKEGFPITEKEEAAYIQTMSEDPHSVSYFAWKGEELVGNITLTGMPRRMGHRSSLGLTVVRAKWGRGIGSLLMERAIAYAEEHGIELVHLEVRSDNERAIRLYRKFGFRKIGVFPAYFKIGEEYFDFDLMVLDLRGKRTGEGGLYGSESL